MTNLIKIEEHPLLKPTLIEIHESDVFQTVTASIARCFVDTNKEKLAAPDLDYLVNEVTDNILKNFPSLRLHEIPIAFANGIRGKYGEYYGLCVVSFEKFINGYLNSDERARLVKEKSQLVIGPQTEPTAQEKFNTAKDLAIKLFDGFKATGQFNISVLAVYEFLKSLDLIDKDYRKGIYTQAVEETIKLKQMDITLSTDLFKRRRLNSELEIFNDNLSKDVLTIDQHEEVLRTGKKIALRNWLNDLIVAEDDFESLIESRRP